MSDPAYRSDKEPGFWPEYQEPTPLARAIQMPLHPHEAWQAGVIAAYRTLASSAPKRRET